MSLKSLIATGTKLWLDSIDPDLVVRNRALGVTGATSNPIIVSDLVKTGRFDDELAEMMGEGKDDSTVAWEITDHLVHEAQEVFWPVWLQTQGNDGYVSFELDPLLEDLNNPIPHEQRVQRYIELAKQWSTGHKNRMIKVPATEAGLAALEEIAAAGVTINVTLIFSPRQYIVARDAIWRGAQRRKNGLREFKSVYSIFISRVDVYTEKYVPELSKDAQGKVGIVNAKNIWRMNQEFWRDKNTPLQQEIVFASTGKKLAWQPEDYYVEALAGSDIMTNPPATNEAIERMNKQYTRTIDKFPPKHVVDEIAQKVDQAKLEAKLMEEGIAKFAEPQHALLKLIAQKRASLAAAN
ncbi:transaldolase family protein [Fontivita pretiosa]|uniref:transaldolase family protein n=1 Tax=Fontivita pretiosa TaxID=2989684 RepID=UPI003D162F23